MNKDIKMIAYIIVEEIKKRGRKRAFPIGDLVIYHSGAYYHFETGITIYKYECASHLEEIDIYNDVFGAKYDFEEVHGIKYPVLYRKNGEKETHTCPFCGNTHIHGIGDGHRNSHCASGEGRMEKVTLKDGTIALQDNGYILKTIE